MAAQQSFFLVTMYNNRWTEKTDPKVQTYLQEHLLAAFDQYFVPPVESIQRTQSLDLEGVSKKCPKWKISSKSDILQNLRSLCNQG